MEISSLSEKIAVIGAEDGVRLLLQEASRSSIETTLACYLLDLKQGKFVLVNPGSKNELLDEFGVDDMETFEDILTADIGDFSSVTTKRNNDVIGKTYIFCKNINDSQTLTHEITQRLDYLPFLYNRRQHERLVRSLNKPVSFDVDQEVFFANLKNIARESSSVQFGAYRTKQDAQLRCLFNWGFDDIVSDENQMNLHTDELPPIHEAMSKGIPVVVSNLARQYPEIVNSRTFTKRVKSLCAVPVHVGENIEGVITFGVGTEYEFSKTEIEAMLCVANGLGVSINNFKQNLRGRTIGSKFELAFTSMVGVEVAALIRHNIYKTSGNIQTLASALISNVRSSGSTNSQKERMLTKAQTIIDTADHISSELGKLKDVMSIDRTVTLTNVKKLWLECTSYLDHRINDLDVDILNPNEHSNVPLMVDVTKHIFHNLMLNSLDVLEVRPKSNRKISLRLENIDKNKKQIALLYSDSGRGLDIVNLNLLRTEIAKDPLSDVSEETPIGELIFRQRLSTKKDGTGYGLFLCRRMAHYHNGSIVYVPNHKNEGVHFRIVLSYDVRELARVNVEPLTVINEKRGTKEVMDVNAFVTKNKL